MSRVIRRIEYNSRAIHFVGTAVFASMGKYVTDFLVRFKGSQWKITSLADNDLAQEQTVLRFKTEVWAYIEAMTQPGSWCRQCGEKQMPGQDQIPHTKACFVRRFLETIDE